MEFHLSMAKSFSSMKTYSFNDVQRRNRRRHVYPINYSNLFESRPGVPDRSVNIIVNRTSRTNSTKAYSNSSDASLLFPLIQEKYDVLSKLNIGAFGATYLIRDSNDGEMYALKRMNCHLPNVFRKRLFEERRLLGYLKSDYILSLISSYTDMEHNCFSMKYEHIGGITLLHLVRHYRWLEESAVAFYSAQIVLAFEYLHELNIIYVRCKKFKSRLRNFFLGIFT